MTTLNELIEEIDAVLEKFQADNFEDEIVADALIKLISEYKSVGESESEWERFCLFDEKKYTRNLVGNGRNNRFGLMILAWGPGQQSPIHDHDGSHCIMKVLKGTLIETLYTAKKEDSFYFESDSSFSAAESDQNEVYEKSRDIILETGQTAYIHDRIGWHRVGNESDSLPAISLHLYSPPIEKFKTFSELDGKVRAQSGSCSYHSINGLLQ